MSSCAVLFPGQGAQFVGMARDVFETFPAARSVFQRADDTLGFSLSDIIFNGPENRLTETDIAQPAILTASIALVEAAREAGWRPDPVATAGLSLGEYTALAFAGVLSFEDAVRLVHRRGAYMREAGAKYPGGMLSVVGLETAAVDEIVVAASADGLVTIANLNCPGQVVLSGRTPPLETAAALAAEKGALKTVFLNVAGAFHSPLMAEAAERLAVDLDDVKLAPPSLPLLSNVTADFVSDPADIRRLLVRQLTSPVLWEQSMRVLIDRGAPAAVEIGPGRVLTGLMRRIVRKFPISPVGDADSVRALAAGDLP